MTNAYKKRDLKEFDINNQIYVLDPLDLGLYHIYSPLDIEYLYESVIIPKRNNLKIFPKNSFDKSNREIDVVSLDISHGCTLKFLEEEKFTVSVSLDGDEENDSKRVFLNNTPSFPLVIKNILTLKKTKIKFACKSTIMPGNKKIVQMFRFFEDNKIPFYHGFATRAFDDGYLPQIEDVNNNLKQLQRIMYR